MAQKRIGGIVDGTYRQMGVGELLFTSANSSWAGFQIECMKVSAGYTGSFSNSSNFVMLSTGLSDVRYRIGRRIHHYAKGPGTILISPCDIEYNQGVFLGDRHRIVIEITGSVATRLQKYENCQLGLRLAHHDGVQDATISSLIAIMKAEIEAGCPSGKIFADSTSLALLSHLSGRYSLLESLRPVSGRRLSRRALQQVLDWIDAHLHGDIDILSLGDLVQVSPWEFCRLFKNSVGISPYRFVILKRIEKAKSFLVERHESIAEISLMLGFSSQSHFTSVFTKVVGESPRRYQRSVAEIEADR